MTFPSLRKTLEGPALRVAAATLVLVSVWAASAAAQGPRWDRRVKALEVIPVKKDFAAAGNPDSVDISVHWTILLDQQTVATLDLSTDIEVQVNGLPIGINSTSCSVPPGAGFCTDGSTCGGSCGTGDVDGNLTPLLCLTDGPGDCKCALGDIIWRLPRYPAPQPGDQITASVAPAPGAEPETEPLGDFVSVTIDSGGGPVYWNRSIDSVVPVSVGPDQYEITVGGLVSQHGLGPFGNWWDGLVPLSFDVEILVNGAQVASSPVSFDPLPIASSYCPCFDACGAYLFDTLYCVYDHTLENCFCSWAYQQTFPVVLILPGEQVDVRLTPAPGALTENPYFADDEFAFSCCPFGTDAQVQPAPGGGSVQLAQNRPNPFRPNGSTTISYSTTAPTTVDLAVYDVQGRRVRTLLHGKRHEKAGDWSVDWDATDDAGRAVQAGTYFYRLTADGTTRTRKMTVLVR